MDSGEEQVGREMKKQKKKASRRRDKKKEGSEINAFRVQESSISINW